MTDIYKAAQQALEALGPYADIIEMAKQAGFKDKDWVVGVAALKTWYVDEILQVMGTRKTKTHHK